LRIDHAAGEQHDTDHRISEEKEERRQIFIHDADDCDSEVRQWHDHAMRCERIIAFLVIVTCNGPSWADDEDAVAEAVADGGCHEFMLTHEGKRYDVSGCGQPTKPFVVAERHP